MNYILDVNIILDCFNEDRKEAYKSSVEVYESLKKSQNAFISSSSLDNLAFIKKSELKKDVFTNKEASAIANEMTKEILTYFKIAKTPSYIDIDYDDIEDSQVLSSAIATEAKVITRDEMMRERYPELTISPEDFLHQEKPKNIDFANLKKQYFLYQDEMEKQMDEVVNNAHFILGDKVIKLEENLQTFTKAKHAITCASGTEALLLALLALDIKAGDEVITTPFTFIATVETVALLGIKPVFVDIDEKTYNIDTDKIEKKITPKTKAIIPVSLYGQPADMDKIQQIATKNNLKVIIDGAQSFGSTYGGKHDSALGDISCTSFFPAKPLGCFGDGGAVFTNDDELATKLKQLRVHGQNKRYHHKYIGLGGRLDALQAAVLIVKLSHYEKDLALRQEVASKYTKALNGKDLVLPHIDSKATSAWAQYSVRVKNRNDLQALLKEKGIPTAVHYPMPLHLQECFSYLGYKAGDFPIAEAVSKEIMSLPMNPYLSDEEIAYIAKALS